MGFRDAFSRSITRLNLAVADSWVGTWFKLDDGRSLDRRTGAVFTVRCVLHCPASLGKPNAHTPACLSTFFVMQTELRAGLTTFAAMAYIISVNAAIISSGGGTCVCDSTPDDPICLKSAVYAACKVPRFHQYLTCTSKAVTASHYRR